MEQSATTITKISEKTKRCPKCGQVKPFSEFYKSAASKSGLQSYCKDCANHFARQKKEHNTTLKNQHPVFSQMQHREIIEEVRERINFLRDNGWTFNGELKYTQVRIVKI